MMFLKGGDALSGGFSGILGGGIGLGLVGSGGCGSRSMHLVYMPVF